jgi:hypothetical protein
VACFASLAGTTPANSARIGNYAESCRTPLHRLAIFYRDSTQQAAKDPTEIDFRKWMIGTPATAFALHFKSVSINMRSAILAHLDGGGAGLDPDVRDAVESLKTMGW